MAEIGLNVGNLGTSGAAITKVTNNLALANAAKVKWVRCDAAVNEMLIPGPSSTPDYTALENFLTLSASYNFKVMLLLEHICPTGISSWYNLAGGDYLSASWPIWKRPPQPMWASLITRLNLIYAHIQSYWTTTLGQPLTSLVIQRGNERNLTGAGGLIEATTKSRVISSSLGGTIDSDATWATLHSLYPGNNYDSVRGVREIDDNIVASSDFGDMDVADASFEVELGASWFNRNTVLSTDDFYRECASVRSGTYHNATPFTDNHEYYTLNVGTGALPNSVMHEDQYAAEVCTMIMSRINYIRDSHSSFILPRKRWIVSELGFPWSWLLSSCRRQSHAQRGQYFAAITNAVRALPIEAVIIYAARNTDDALDNYFGLSETSGNWSPALIPFANNNGASLSTGVAPVTGASWIAEVT